MAKPRIVATNAQLLARKPRIVATIRHSASDYLQGDGDGAGAGVAPGEGEGGAGSRDLRPTAGSAG
ncbi:MAG TPA: hypothetical protein VNA65_07460, partial [Candidatus Dormibacteraeota bacterium]|nr:hypothetical protein [Candidatus Dormibacteraeota bacterium]